MNERGSNGSGSGREPLRYDGSDLELMANAYVDDQLTAEQRLEFEAQCQKRPDLRALVDDYTKLNRALRGLHVELMHAQPPRRHLSLMTSPGFSSFGRWHVGLAAGLTGILVGALLGWYGARTTITDELIGSNDTPSILTRPVAQEAVLAHTIYTREKRHAVEVQATESGHLNAWLSNRLAQPVSAPDLRSLGFNLVGGRLLADAGKPAAQFMFENDEKQRLTLFIRSFVDFVDKKSLARFADDPAFQSDQGMGVWYWPQSGLYYALTGALNKEALRQLVDHIRKAGADYKDSGSPKGIGKSTAPIGG